jgi:hypothetical protein
MRFFFGNLHGHSAVSDGEGTPDEGYDWARFAAGLDFYAITDHASLISPGEWRLVGESAAKKTVDGKFVALRGFEWSSWTFGHINVYGTSSYVNAKDLSDPDEFYAWLNRTGGLAQFNHPGRVAEAFQGLGYKAAVADNLFGIETGNKEHGNVGGRFLPFFSAGLRRGWRIAPTNNQDNHRLRTNSHRTVIIAPRLSRAALLDALRSRRCYSSDDPNLELRFKFGERWMGSQVVHDKGRVRLDVAVKDDEPINRVELRALDGKLVTARDVEGEAVKASFTIELTGHSGYFVVVRAEDTNEDDPDYTEQVAVSAPIWFFVGR